MHVSEHALDALVRIGYKREDMPDLNAITATISGLDKDLHIMCHDGSIYANSQFIFHTIPLFAALNDGTAVDARAWPREMIEYVIDFASKFRIPTHLRHIECIELCKVAHDCGQHGLIAMLAWYIYRISTSQALRESLEIYNECRAAYLHKFQAAAYKALYRQYEGCMVVKLCGECPAPVAASADLISSSSNPSYELKCIYCGIGHTRPCNGTGYMIIRDHPVHVGMANARPLDDLLRESREEVLRHSVCVCAFGAQFPHLAEPMRAFLARYIGDRANDLFMGSVDTE